MNAVKPAASVGWHGRKLGFCPPAATGGPDLGLSFLVMTLEKNGFQVFEEDASELEEVHIRLRDWKDPQSKALFG